jgi:hypothetical protein
MIGFMPGNHFFMGMHWPNFTRKTNFAATQDHGFSPFTANHRDI